MTAVMTMPTVRLSNGITVANFSSPHPFEFESGETLPACDEDRVRAASLNKRTVESPSARHADAVDVSVYFEMSDSCRDLLEEAEKLAAEGGIDVILVPFPVREVICRSREIADLSGTPFRVILVPDRVTRKVSPSKFCV